MPVLRNARHEAFAQHLAKGCSQEEAYRRAGYEGDVKARQASAARLFRNVQVQQRLAELQSRTARRTVETAIGITADLRAMYDEACSMTRTHGPAAVQAATRALMGIAKLNGLIVDHRHVHEKKDVEDFTREELVEMIREHQRERGEGDPPATIN